MFIHAHTLKQPFARFPLLFIIGTTNEGQFSVAPVGPSGQDPRTKDAGLRSSDLLALQPRIRQAGSCESTKGIGASRAPQPSKRTNWSKDVSYAHVLKGNRRCE
jgi:hypothetical protein